MAKVGEFEISYVLKNEGDDDMLAPRRERVGPEL